MIAIYQVQHQLSRKLLGRWTDSCQASLSLSVYFQQLVLLLINEILEGLPRTMYSEARNYKSTTQMTGHFPSFRTSD
jgi:hypothetical protein